MNFREYLKTLNKKEQKKRINFVKNYKKLISQGTRKHFGLRQNVMNIKEALNSRDAAVLVTKVIEGALEESAEPLYIGTELFDKINVDNNNRIVFPALGQLRADVIPEGGEYPRDHLDVILKEGATQVDVTKKGLIVPITEEMIEDSLWEVVAAHIRAGGRAMARLKEELIYKQMSKFGHPVFNNDLRAKHPEAGTNGLNEYGQPNDTLSVEDVFDIVVALMNNEYMPTDCLIHPLTWSVFVKNGLVNIFNNPALGGNDSIGSIDTDVTNGRLPVAINIMSSPFIPFDRQRKRFDMYVVDRNNIGVIIQRENMTTDQFNDPYLDIQNLKLKERYGIGLLDEGKAVAVAKNIALDTSFEKPDLVRVINAEDYGNIENDSTGDYPSVE